MIVVSNSTPLVGLSIISRFELLRQLLGEVRLPSAVYQEMTATGTDRALYKRILEETAAT